MTINYKNYKMIQVEFDGTVWMSDDPPCNWWLVIRCDAEHDRKVLRYGLRAKRFKAVFDETYKSSKKTYHSIIKELWI